MSHNYFTSLSLSPIESALVNYIGLDPYPLRTFNILYGHLISFTQTLRFLCIYRSLRNAELVRKEEALYLRFFTQELKMRKFTISCCEQASLNERPIQFKDKLLDSKNRMYSASLTGS